MSIYRKIEQQWNEMLERGIIPVMEFQRTMNGDTDWFVVNIELSKKGINFSFDQDGLLTYFDYYVTGSNNFYHIPFKSVAIDTLDEYLYIISDNIGEGYLIANNIYVDEE